MATSPSTNTHRSRGALIARVGAAIVHVGIGVFPLSASGLLAPPWALATVAVGWLFGLAMLWRIGRCHPGWAFVAPVATLAAWFAFISLGERFLGWTA